MRKVVNKYFVTFSLILVVCVSLLLGYKTLNNKKDIPEKYKTNSERKQFAMFIKNNENNQYETYEGDEFPEGYRANLDKSMCTDINGNIIKDIISNSENGITITSNKTVYCEIYMDEKGVSGSDITSIPIPNILESTGVVEDELAVRYYGTNPDNYICFGTSNKDTCIGDTDKYMYRIIGIDKSGRYKLIKREALDTKYAWHSENIDMTWPESDLYKGLNGSYFLNNTTYMLSDWSDKIAMMSWKYGDLANPNQNASIVLQAEQGFSTTTSAKIGLMYATDYYYAYQKSGLNCQNSSQYPICKTSWMHISQSYDDTDYRVEWTMAAPVYSAHGHSAWAVDNTGGVGWQYVLTSNLLIRPVFYLVPEIEISGTGTIDNPFLIVN